MGRNFLGEFEQIVLLAMARARDEAYAVSIYDEILRTIGRSVSIPAVYVTLSRLEKKGFVRSWMGEPSPTRGGRAKRYFKLAGKGREALEQSRVVLDQLWDGLKLETK
ncbi:MAG: PadR family transcriptional regulator [Acidobacteria bacterium]|nr:PadR family transcriptional regulator [Acidobacteriota bacterium]